MADTFCGIEIGGTKIQIVLGAGEGLIQRRLGFQVELENGAEGIRRGLKSRLAPLFAADRPRAIGVAFGGPVDWRSGKALCSHQVPGWEGFNLAAWLRLLGSAPVAVENDANVAALAEASRGAGRGKSRVFYVTLGSGVGGGMIVDGAIYHGASPCESEIGHIHLGVEDATIESRCSGWAVDRKIVKAMAQEPSGALASLVGAKRGSEAAVLGAAVAQQDPQAIRILQETAKDLALGLSHVTHLFHPEIIVLGGGLSKVGQALTEAVATAAPQFLMKVLAPGPPIVSAQLGDDVAPVGALILAAQSVASRPLT